MDCGFHQKPWRGERCSPRHGLSISFRLWGSTGHQMSGTSCCRLLIELSGQIIHMNTRIRVIWRRVTPRQLRTKWIYSEPRVLNIVPPPPCRGIS